MLQQTKTHLIGLVILCLVFDGSATQVVGQSQKGNEADAAAPYERSKLSASEGKYSLAESEMSSAIAKKPDEPLYYEARGTLRGCQGKLKEALLDYTDAVRLGRRTVSLFRNRGKIHFDLGEHEKALSDYTSAIELKPNEIGLRAERIAVYYYLKRLDDVAAEVAAVLGADQHNVTALVYRGMLSHEKKDFPSAQSDFSRAIELDPRSESAIYNRGSLHFDLGEYEKAANDFSKVLELSGPDVATLHARARCYIKQRKSAEAIQDLLNANALDNRSYKLHLDIAELLSNLPSRMHEAYYHADEAVALSPNQSESLRIRGVILHNLGNFRRAEVDLTAAIKLNPRDAMSYAYRAGTIIDSDPKRALKDLTKALELDSKCCHVFAVRGCHALRHGKWTEGIQDLETAVELGMIDLAVYYHLSMAYGASPVDQVRNGPLATAYAKKAIESFPESPRPGLIALSVAQAEQSDFERAVEIAKKALIGATGKEKDLLDKMIVRFEKLTPYRIQIQK